jgi:hypothetical protein
VRPLTSGQGRPDVEPPAGQVDVLAGQREQLPEPQAGEQGGGDRRSATPRRDGDHLERLLERQHGRLAGVAARHLHAEQRQRLEVPVDLRGLEAAAQHGDGLPDAAGRQRSGDLPGDPAPDVVRVDLRERQRAEDRQQLAAQDPAVAGAGLVLQRPGVDPVRGVGGERRRGGGPVVPSASWSSTRRLNASASARVSPALREYCRPVWSRQV